MGYLFHYIETFKIIFLYSNYFIRTKIYSRIITQLYNEVFSWLPLASLIDEKIYVVHGGISDLTCFKKILKIKREQYVSVLKPNILNDKGALTESPNTSQMLEWRQVSFKII